MQKNMRLNGKLICYELEYKPVKNVNLRVRKDGSVYVSAPFQVSEAFIENVLQEKAAFILHALERVSLLAPSRREDGLQSGDTVYLLGEAKRIHICYSPRETAAVDGTCLILETKTPEDSARAREIVIAYLNTAFTPVIEAVCRRIFPPFGAKGAPVPIIRTRFMTSRWGSCIPAKNVVTFNTRLYQFPVPLIEYVACHEFTHFFVQNHSPAFYADLEGFLPDRRQREAEMKAFAAKKELL